MNRRTFVGAAAGGLLVAHSTMGAQAPPKVWRIGFISAASRQTLADAGYYPAFLQGMRELGYVEGKNLDIEVRYADGNYERLPDLAAELV